MIRNALVLLISIVLPQLVQAQGTSTGSTQLKIPLTARAAAMGEATVSDPSHFSSWSVNPANLYSEGPLTIGLTHAQWIQETQSEFVGVQVPSYVGTFGLSVSSTSVPGIEVRDVPGPPVGTFSARFAGVQMGFATSVMSDVTLGVTGKYLYEKLYTDDATGYGFDLGILYRTPLQGLNAGISLTNVGSIRAFRSERSDLPTFLRGGVSYVTAYDDLDLRGYAAIASNVMVKENHEEASLEATYRKLVVIRVGYQAGFDSRGFATGLGLRYEFIQFDYAFLPFSLGLGDSHFFTLEFRI